MAHLEPVDTCLRKPLGFFGGSVGRLDMAHCSPLGVKQQQNKTSFALKNALTSKNQLCRLVLLHIHTCLFVVAQCLADCDEPYQDDPHCQQQKN